MQEASAETCRLESPDPGPRGRVPRGSQALGKRVTTGEGVDKLIHGGQTALVWG